MRPMAYMVWNCDARVLRKEEEEEEEEEEEGWWGRRRSAGTASREMEDMPPV